MSMRVTLSLDPICPVCDKPIHDGAWLCIGCGKTLRRALANIIAWRPELDTTILRLDNVRTAGTFLERGAFDTGNPKPGSRFREPPIPNEDPIPFRPPASEVAWVVDNTIATWARDLMETTGAELPEPTPSAPLPAVLQPRATGPSCDLTPAHPTARAALLLWRHVDWWRRRQEAPEIYSEVLAVEIDLRKAIDTSSRDNLAIGECPIEWPDPDNDDLMRTCGGTVYAWPTPRHTLAELQRDYVRDPTCSRCKTEGDLNWWQAQIMPELAATVTATDLIGVIAFELRTTVTHDQIRQWKARGKIEAAGRDAKGRTLYDHRDVIARMREDLMLQKRERVAS